MTNCNLIIPTYNRPNYLQRILDYYHKHGSDFDMIVADSSSDELKKLNRRIISSFPDLNIQYLDRYPSEISSHHKFADMVNYAEQKYCVFCADDDFVIPSGIKQSIDFLEKNPEFTVAHGHYISFRLKAKKRGEKRFCWTPRYSNGRSITFSEPKLRLIKHLSNFSLPTVYGVHRTIFLKMIHKELLNSKVDLLTFGELLPSMLDLIYGKMKQLDVLYIVRQSDSPVNRWSTLPDLMNEGRYDEEYARFRGCLAAHLTKKSQLDIEESKRIVDSAMPQYLKRSSHSLAAKTVNILHKLNTPDRIYKKISLLYRGLISLSSLTKILPPKYYDDFNKIRTCVMSHAIKNNKDKK